MDFCGYSCLVQAGPEHRELLVAEKQWKEIVELAFEQLPEIIQE